MELTSWRVSPVGLMNLTFDETNLTNRILSEVSPEVKVELGQVYAEVFYQFVGHNGMTDLDFRVFRAVCCDPVRSSTKHPLVYECESRVGLRLSEQVVFRSTSSLLTPKVSHRALATSLQPSPDEVS
jgi:hypothetical protein